MAHSTKAWRVLEVRPPGDSQTSERTLEQYCTYDERHNYYGYKDAYVRKLVRECATSEGFLKLLGMAPKDKETGAIVGGPATTVTDPVDASGDATTPVEDEEQAS